MYLLLKMDNYGKRETVECGVSCDLLEAPPLKLFEPRERRENEDAALDRRSEDELDEEGSHEDDGDHDNSEEDKEVEEDDEFEYSLDEELDESYEPKSGEEHCDDIPVEESVF